MDAYKKEYMSKFELLFGEIETALKNKMLYSALALSLILPDICCKVENHIPFNKEVSGNEYKEWIKRHFLSQDEEIIKQLDGKIIYQLRCRVLHSGNTACLPKTTTNEQVVIHTEQTCTAMYSSSFNNKNSLIESKTQH